MEVRAGIMNKVGRGSYPRTLKDEPGFDSW